MKLNRILILGLGILGSLPLRAEDAVIVDVKGADALATINGETIPVDLYRQFYSERGRAQRGASDSGWQETAFERFVDVIVTAQDAERQGLDEQPDNAMALELQRMKLMSRMALQHAALSSEPSEEELQAAYDERYANAASGSEYKARHILVPDEEAAKALIVKLDEGADFAELATEHSKGPTARKGGDLDWFAADRMVKPFSEAVAQLEVGAYTKEPVQTQFGWHVILLEDKRESAPPSLEDVKGRLTLILQRQKLKDYLAGLREGAEVELNEEVVSALSGGEEPAEEEAEASDAEAGSEESK